MARAIFVGGTGSNAGKSWMTTAICRLLRNRGFRVAPFKAQNMSNNSFPCRGGGEIGRSQVVQAEACGLEPEPAMNPVLLKPMSDSRSQVVLHGKVWRTVPAREYYQHTPFLRDQALLAYEDLARRFDVIVMEGAGSVAEVNLWGRDFTNLSMAHAAGARALLVADIERGGVFAAILGTLDLLPPEYRSLVRAYAINRFRGDRSLFDDGVRILEDRSQLPCLGVFPYTPDLRIDAEDSLSDPPLSSQEQQPNIAIIRFPQISNTTDFRLLANARWLGAPDKEIYQFVILPGTKSTLADLQWLRSSGLAEWVLRQRDSGARVLGICGGYQMLGETIDDPTGADGEPCAAEGLGLLPVHTVMAPWKTTEQRKARTPGGSLFEAYEIHMGETGVSRPQPPFAFLEDGTPEGVDTGGVAGTYLHGALESPEVVTEYFGFTPPAGLEKQVVYDKLAAWLETYASPSALAALLD